MIYYENESGKSFSGDIEDVEKLAEKLLESSLDYLGCEYECECNLLITDSGMIHELNRNMRGVDRTTDVLSFPLIDFNEPFFESEIDENDCSLFNPDTGMLMLGDIVICYEKVYAQAEEYGHSVLREFAFLILHSILHLFGYDHMEDDERIVMERMQKEILDNIGITR